MENFDLHNHSTRSDGLLTPTQLIELAADNGVDAVALTDHDTVDGLEEAALAARQRGIAFVTGVEISVTWGSKTIHVVGLGVDPEDAALVAGLRSISDGRFGRGERIARQLAGLGIPDTLEGALALAGSPVKLSRAHFARHLAERGHVKSTQAAFDKYLGTGKAAYVAHSWTTLENAVSWIRTAGGIAVLAHPGRYDLKPMMREELLKAFRACGGEAIEVVTGSHRPEEFALWQREAIEHGLLASRGADYHGPGESSHEPGRLPSLHGSLRPVWSHWAH